jgi:hypothetical protein
MHHRTYDELMNEAVVSFAAGFPVPLESDPPRTGVSRPLSFVFRNVLQRLRISLAISGATPVALLAQLQRQPDPRAPV